VSEQMKRKSIEELQLPISNQYSLNNQTEEVFEFAAGFAPYLRGTNATGYALKEIKINIWRSFTAFENFTNNKTEKVNDLNHFCLNYQFNQEEEIIDICQKKHMYLCHDNATSRLNLDKIISVAKQKKIEFNCSFAIEINVSEQNQIDINQIECIAAYFSIEKILFVVKRSANQSTEIRISDALENAYYCLEQMKQSENLKKNIQKIHFVWELESEIIENTAIIRASRWLWATKTNLAMSVDVRVYDNQFHLDELSSHAQLQILIYNAIFASVNEIDVVDHLNTNNHLQEKLTQLVMHINQESKISKTIDVFGGNNLVENRTKAIFDAVWFKLKDK
jgi:hypothetical protein